MKKIFKALSCAVITLLPMTAFSQQMTSFGVQPIEFTSYQIDFPQGKSALIEDFKDNKKALRSLAENINNNTGKLNHGEYIISVLSETLIDGNEPKARRLAKKRALTLKSYFIKTVGAEEKFFITTIRTGEKDTVADAVRMALEPKNPQDDKSLLKNL